MSAQGPPMPPRLVGSGRYAVLRRLGRGSSGDALLCTRWPAQAAAEDSSMVVIKQVRLFGASEKERADALNEAHVMQELDHLNCVRYFESFEESGCLYMVMEHCHYGELASFIHHRAAEQRPFSEDEVMFMFVQVALGLWHVHSKQILHRDLKSQNVFVGEGGILKLGDFGISRSLASPDSMARTAVGTPYYLSPEICQDKPYNRKSDTWALGCVLYELTTLRRAFDGNSLPALVVNILGGKYPPVPVRYGPELRSLVEALLRQSPRERPSSDDVLRMPFVRPHLARYARHVVNLQQREAPCKPPPAALASSRADATEVAQAAGPRSSDPGSAQGGSGATACAAIAAAAAHTAAARGARPPEAATAAAAAMAAAAATAAAAAATAGAAAKGETLGSPPSDLGTVRLASSGSCSLHGARLRQLQEQDLGQQPQQQQPQQQQPQQQQLEQQQRQQRQLQESSCSTCAVSHSHLSLSGGLHQAAQSTAEGCSSTPERTCSASDAVAEASSSVGSLGASGGSTSRSGGRSCDRSGGRSAGGTARADRSSEASACWLQKQQAALAEMEAAFRNLGLAGPGGLEHHQALQREETQDYHHQQHEEQQQEQQPEVRHGRPQGQEQARQRRQQEEQHRQGTGQQQHLQQQRRATAGQLPPSGARPDPSIAKRRPHAQRSSGGQPPAPPSTSAPRPRQSRSSPGGSPAAPPAGSAAAAARKQRLCERAEHDAARRREAEGEAARRAARAAEVEAHCRGQEEERRRAREEAQAILQAHRARTRAAKPRLSRSELSEQGKLFAKHFAESLHPHQDAGDGGLAAAGGDGSCEAADSGGGSCGAAADGDGQQQPMFIAVQVGREQKIGGSSGSNAHRTNDMRPAEGHAHQQQVEQQHHDRPPPPWRRRSSVQHSAGGGWPDPQNWPEVQIFAPYGSDLCTGQGAPCASPTTTSPAAAVAVAVAVAPAADALSAGQEAAAAAAAAAPDHAADGDWGLELRGQRQGPQLRRGKSVVALIQDVLSASEDGGGGSGGGGGGGGSGCCLHAGRGGTDEEEEEAAVHLSKRGSLYESAGRWRWGPSDPLQLPPERGQGPGADEAPGQGRLGAAERQPPPDAVGGGGGEGAAAALAARAEALRRSLEAELGRDKLVLAYQYLWQMQQQQQQDELEEAAGCEPDASPPSGKQQPCQDAWPGGPPCGLGGSGRARALLSELLGAGKLHLAGQVQKLLVLEELASLHGA